MSQRLIGRTSYLLLIVIDLLLKILFNIFSFVFYILKATLRRVINVKMTEAPKKYKRLPKQETNGEGVILKRGVIDANWQRLLISPLMDQNDVNAQKEEKSNYTHTSRRARRKKVFHDLINVPNLKTLDITNALAASSENSDCIIANNNNKSRRITKFLAMDCEMVGIGYNGRSHMLARVSIVNKFGDCIYDKFVKPREEIVDYRTSISGIRREDVLNGEEFDAVQREVAELLRGKILVGHSLKNDLGVLYLSHGQCNMRDISRYKPFRKITKGSTPSLKLLASEILGIDIQHGEHSSVEDAKAAMQLYCMVAKSWEQTLGGKRGYSKKFVES